jgi:hypothetical protein
MNSTRGKWDITSGILTRKSLRPRKTFRHSQKVLKKKCRDKGPKCRKAPSRYISLNRTFKHTTKRASGSRKSSIKLGFINRRMITKVNRKLDYNYKNVLMLL